jgi:hypothetical protein
MLIDGGGLYSEDFDMGKSVLTPVLLSKKILPSTMLSTPIPIETIWPTSLCTQPFYGEALFNGHRSSFRPVVQYAVKNGKTEKYTR